MHILHCCGALGVVGFFFTNTTLLAHSLLLGLIFEELMLGTLFLVIIATIWLGTSNAAREIVGEMVIYRRERMFNLRILPYMLSKIIVLNFFGLIQILLMTGIVHFLMGWANYWQTLGILCLVSFTGTLMGLLISALANNPNKVMSTVPLLLLPQIMLAGVIQRIMSTAVEVLSFLSV